jgi:GNAT superfamily N-acetyltransferase
MSVCEPVCAVNLSSYSFQPLEPARLALADRFYRTHGYKVKCGPSERVFALVSLTGELVAVARFVPQASGHYWLRNLLVTPELRGYGLASRLLRETRSIIFPAGCYCFALRHLVDFYSHLEFETSPGHCPADIAAIYERYRSRGRDWVLMGYKQQ